MANPRRSCGEEFVNQYILGDGLKKRNIYIQLFVNLKDSISTGNISRVKDICKALSKIHLITTNKKKLYKFYNDSNNPFVNTNLIIFCCKHDQFNILKYFFDPTENVCKKLIENWGIKIYLSAVDSCGHNAFYYAMRSNDVKLMRLLMNNLPEYDPTLSSEEINELISQSYAELRLRNVEISDGIECFVEEKLLQMKFFVDEKDDRVKSMIMSKNDILQRTDLVIAKIAYLLSFDFLPDDDLRLLYNAKFIAQNIFVLKSALKSTYISVPWEEMEFCLIIYVRTKVTNEELNMLYESVLSQKRLRHHLKNFSDCLNTEKNNFMCENSVNEFPNYERREVVKMICEKRPFFQTLYSDYKHCRDFCSLYIIKNYLDKFSIVFLSPKDKNWHMIYLRTLQVIGEHLRFTLEHPKMSETRSKRLLANLPQNVRDIVVDFWNAAASKLSLRRMNVIEDESGDEFFNALCIVDLDKMNKVVSNILIQEKIHVFKTHLKKLIACENALEAKEALKIFRFLKIDPIDISNSQANMEELIANLCSELPHLSVTELPLIESILMAGKRKLDMHDDFNKVQDYPGAHVLFVSFKDLLLSNKSFSSDLSMLKHLATTLLSSMSTNQEIVDVKNLEFYTLKLFRSLAPRLSENEYYHMFKLISEMFDSVSSSPKNDGTLQNLLDELTNHCPKKSHFEKDKSMESSNVDLVEESLLKRVAKLKDCLGSCLQGSPEKLEQLLSNFKKNKSLHGAVEMYVLDILSILNQNHDRLTHNVNFIDDNTPSLVGYALFDFLAFKNHMAELSLHNPSTSLALNAKLLSSENILGKKFKIGKMTSSNISILKERDRCDTMIITNQQTFFKSLQDGNVGLSKSCLEKGADIDGRCANSLSSLHLAAIGPSVELLNFIITSWKGKVNIKNVDGQNPLHTAALHGRVEHVKVLLKASIPVDEKDNLCRTALHLAAAEGHSAVVAVLLEHKADPRLLDGASHTPLKRALYNNHVSTAKLLLTSEKDNSLNTVGLSPLHISSKVGSIEMVEYFVNNGANVNVVTDNGVRPLHLASRNGHLTVVKFLLSSGADVNAKTLTGSTALVEAVTANQIGIASILVQKGAGVNASTVDGVTPLVIASARGNKNICNFLLQKKARANVSSGDDHTTPLHWAAWGGHLEIIELLINYRAQVNSQNGIGATPLHMSTYKGHLESVELLLKHGAKPEVRTNDGCTAIFYAAATGCERLVQILIDCGSGCNTTDVLGLTPLHLSCLVENKGVAEMLLTKGSKVNNQCYNSTTPLFLAIVKDSVEIVQLLLSRGANVNQSDGFGCSPLHIACGLGNLKIIETLIEAGAYVNQKDNIGYVALHFASFSNEPKVATLLINKGCSVDSTGEDGVSPLVLAVQCCNKDNVKMLLTQELHPRNVYKALQLAVCLGFTDIVELMLNHRNQFTFKLSDLLLIACFRRCHKIIKLLINKGADPNHKFYSDSSRWIRPLMLASDKGYDDVIHSLVKSGADPSMKGMNNETPLHRAALKGRLKAAEALLFYKSNLMSMDKSRSTPLHLAVAYGHVDVVRLFLNHDENINVTKIHTVKNNFSLIHLAAESGNIDVVKLLVEKGADMTAKCDSDLKAIHVAAFNGFPDIVEFFLSQNVDLYDHAMFQTNLLHCVAYGARGNYVGVVQLLINDRKMDVNQENQFGATPLSISIFYKNDGLLTFLLLQKGAFYDERNPMGFSPIDGAVHGAISSLLRKTKNLLDAAKKGNMADAKRCIENGGVIDAKNRLYESPLICATWKGYINIVNMLLSKNANPNILGKRGSTPLHYACKISRYDIVVSLLVHGAVFNAKNEGGKSPLDYASRENIKSLLIFIQECFDGIERADIAIVDKIWQFKRNSVQEVSALSNCCNNKGQCLVAAAVATDFPEVTVLNKIFYNDPSVTDEAIALASMGKHNDAFMKCQAELNYKGATKGVNKFLNSEIEAIMGDILFDQQKFAEALVFYKRSFSFLKEILGSEHNLTLVNQSNVAKTLYNLGKEKEANVMLMSVYEKQKQNYNPLSVHFIRTHLNTAPLLVEMGMPDEAIKNCIDIAGKTKILIGPQHGLTLASQITLSSVLNDTCRNNEALKVLKQVYEIRKSVLGATHHGTVEVLFSMATVCNRRYEFDRSLDIYGQILNLKKKSIFKSDADKALSLINQGQFYRALGLVQNLFENLKINDNQLLKCLQHIMVACRSLRMLAGNEFFSSCSSSYSDLVEIMTENIRQNQNRETFLFGSYRQKKPQLMSDIMHEVDSIDLLIRESLLNYDCGVNKPLILSPIFQFFNEQPSNFFDHSSSSSEDDQPDFFGWRHSQQRSKMDDKLDMGKVLSAIAVGDVQIVDQMLRERVDFNITDAEGRTPLHHAVSKGNANLIIKLIENNACVSVKSAKGNTPLHAAVLTGNREVAEILLNNVEDADRSSFINCQTVSKGTTALHVAASKGNIDIVKLLLTFGASYNSINKENKTPIDLSTSEDVTRYLGNVDRFFKNIESLNKDFQVDEDWVSLHQTRNLEGKTLLSLMEECTRLLCNAKVSHVSHSEQREKN